ncbi:helix-turn-helix domain-containing protein [Cupriavidus sp. TMH.W2]|uniref:helix-turn-helix domain-containing protein n=1 Tax=Cupriavidus sp. TMH.W2 TaxID=3434465 RepID=UPI003D78118E
MGHSGSLASAARALHVNHSTVLRRLARLEEAPGTLLFERHATGYAMTAAVRGAAPGAAGRARQPQAGGLVGL